MTPGNFGVVRPAAGKALLISVPGMGLVVNPNPWMHRITTPSIPPMKKSR